MEVLLDPMGEEEHQSVVEAHQTLIANYKAERSMYETLLEEVVRLNPHPPVETHDAD